MYKINFNHLYYFLTIAKEGSIVKAAKKLNMTQPALSHQLKLLEIDLGKKLFDRLGKRLVINQDGESVKDYASKIFRHSEEMIQFLKSDSDDYLKIIKIGTVPWVPVDEIYDFIKTLIFSQHIRIEVYQRSLDSLVKDIQNNRIDLILCDSPYSGRSKKLQGHRIDTDPIFCVSANKNGFKGTFPKNIDGKKMVNFSEASLLADKIHGFLKSNKLKLSTVGAFTDTSLMRVTAERGGVIAFLPKSVVARSIKAKSLVKLGELKSVNFSLWAITKKDYKQDSLIANLILKNKKN